ncbi:hypothetical protein PIB30_067026, partial [Stylosanthes scabra]|nr:hypothetical protein [Stylosanthes scabra]
GMSSRPLQLNTDDHNNKKPIKSMNVLKPAYMSVKRLVAEAGHHHHSKGGNMVRKLVVVDEAGPSPQGQGHSSTPTYH